MFLSKLIYEDILGSKYIRLVEPFRYYSKILHTIIEVPTGFVCDRESVPILKATSTRGGVIHDYLSRKDSIPHVSKQMAASVYLEVQECRDGQLKYGLFGKADRWFRRQFKTIVVRVAPGYFHKFKVMATLEDIRGY